MIPINNSLLIKYSLESTSSEVQHQKIGLVDGHSDSFSFLSRIQAIAHAMKHLWERLIYSFSFLPHHQSLCDEHRLLQGEISTLQEHPEFKALSDFVSVDHVKLERLFGSSQVVLEDDWKEAMPSHWITRQEYHEAIQCIHEITQQKKFSLHTLTELMIMPDSRKHLLDLWKQGIDISLSLEAAGAHYSFATLNYDHTSATYLIEHPCEDFDLTNDDSCALLTAFHQGAIDQIETIMREGNHIQLLAAYFEGIQYETSPNVDAFSKRVLDCLTEEDLEEIIRLYGQIEEPLNETFAEALLVYTPSSSQSEKHQMLCWIAVCLAIPSPSSLWQEETAKMIEKGLKTCIENSSAVFMTESLAGKLCCFLAFGCDEKSLSSILDQDTLNIYRLRFAKLLSYLGNYSKVFDAQVRSLLYHMDPSTLSVDVLGPYFFQSTYLRTQLLKLSQDPSFTQGKETLLIALWEHLLSLKTIEEGFLDIIPMPDEITDFPIWKNAHREEILHLIQSLGLQ